MSRPKFGISGNLQDNQDMIDRLGSLNNLLKDAQNVLYKGADGKYDPSVLDHIALWQEPAHTDMIILNKYVTGLEGAADHVIEKQFKKVKNVSQSLLSNSKIHM